MGRRILLLISLLTMTAYTLTAIWLGINNATTITIIECLPLLFSPARFVYCFSFFLFASLFIFIWQTHKNRQSIFALSSKQTTLFIGTCFLQSLFFYEWHNEHLIIATISFVVSLISLFGLYITYPLNKESIQFRIPISLWLGWSLFFTLVIVSYMIMYYEWKGFGLSNGLWAVIMLSLGTAIALHLRYHHFDRVTPGIFIWCYVGIAITNGFDELFVTTAALFLCGVLATGIIFIRKKSTV
ncbi:tryptophan-rich sensory protein [Lysinibacillus sp. 54212]|uniref:tryptophan-rich sensory protein n=1 Tax=Lysinibacillus sp. 54212 TaxID=3119829 RepID=UPI002FC8C361